MDQSNHHRIFEFRSELWRRTARERRASAGLVNNCQREPGLSSTNVRLTLDRSTWLCGEFLFPSQAVLRVPSTYSCNASMYAVSQESAHVDVESLEITSLSPFRGI